MTKKHASVEWVILATALFLSFPLAAQIFSPPELITTTPAPRVIALEDVNSDKRLDLIVGAGTSIQVLSQLEDGTFAAPDIYSGLRATSVDVGDFNRDGLMDIVSPHNDGIALLLQTAQGTLEVTAPLPSAEAGDLVRVGDFNHDGRDDVAALPRGTNNDDVYIYIQGDDGLLPHVTYTMDHTGFLNNDLRVGDLNGDGRDDLVAVSATSPDHDNISVLLQDPLGGFEDQVLYDAPGNRTYDCVEIGDVNDDGLDDLVLCPIGPAVHIFIQTETGTLEFLDSYDLGAEGFHDSMAIRDLDGDGLNELIGVSFAHLVVLSSPAHPGGIQVLETHDLESDINFFDPHHLVVDDINADSLIDVALANPFRGIQILSQPPVFSDGFESGDTLGWTASLP